MRNGWPDYGLLYYEIGRNKIGWLKNTLKVENVKGLGKYKFKRDLAIAFVDVCINNSEVGQKYKVPRS